MLAGPKIIKLIAANSAQHTGRSEGLIKYLSQKPWNFFQNIKYLIVKKLYFYIALILGNEYVFLNKILPKSKIEFYDSVNRKPVR